LTTSQAGNLIYKMFKLNYEELVELYPNFNRGIDQKHHFKMLITVLCPSHFCRVRVQS